MTVDEPTLDEPTLDEPTPFALTGPLPRGTVVLEASAGTGKTFAIAALATRYVAEAGIGLSELLLVTFTRAAAAELRERVRTRLVQATGHLEALLAGAEVTAGDELLDHLGAASPNELRVRHQRLLHATTELETATITTIHGFCQQVLRGIGFAADVPQHPTLMNDQQELLEQVVGDRIVAGFVDRGGAPPHKDVLAAAQAATADPDATLVPDDPPAEDDHESEDAAATARLIAQVARESRDEVDRRKRVAGILSHDDLLTRLRDAIRNPATGDAAIAVLRDRYRIALIDEFQDTDPVQWEILDRAFGSGYTDNGADRAAPTTRATGHERALVLIGDPKQAIYAFRGADVHAYLEATRKADARHTLATSWRCDGPLVSALNRFFSGTVYGDAGITQRDLQIAPHLADSRLGGLPELAAPLTIRAVTAVGPTFEAPSSRSVRGTLIPADVAAEITRMLADDALTVEGRACAPGDIAVLVQANADAAVLQHALRQARIPAVINGVGSVFATPSAQDWHFLLDALERPSSTRAARRLAVTDFAGWSGEELAAADDAVWDRFHARLHVWAATLREHGIAALFRQVTTDSNLAARVLAHVGGERRLTDLRQIAGLLHVAETDGARGPAALAAWLDERIQATDIHQVPPDEQARRLESDAHAVQILTVHRSKGLEFPIVLCPYLWIGERRGQPPLTIHENAPPRRVIDVGPTDRDGYRASYERWKDAQRGEALRLLYVAMTRARHRVVVWWIAMDRRQHSALGDLLFSREHGSVLNNPDVPYPDRDATVEVLEALMESCGGRVETVSPTITLEPRETGTGAPPTLAAADLHRAVDRSWRRTSYSGIVGDQPPGHAEDPAAGADDEADEDLFVSSLPTDDDTRADDGRDLHACPLPLADIRGSAHLGTMLHDVLEHTDFAASDLRATLAAQLTTQQQRYGVFEDHQTLLTGLEAALLTPLGPLADERALADITRRDRLDEPRFELPLAGGDQNDGQVAALRELSALFEQHLPPTDPLVGYHRKLRNRRFRVDLRGYLNGAIDLVCRLDGQTPAESRYLVVDYKSNRLGWPQTPTAWHYRPDALAVAMQDAHYPLQALLYAVALHRMLRWRLPDYDPDRNLGGVAYLFLRGMTGAEVPRVGGQPCGVFSWHPPTGLVLAASDLLDGRGKVRR